jgi:hypothetical protein
VIWAFCTCIITRKGLLCIYIGFGCFNASVKGGGYILPRSKTMVDFDFTLSQIKRLTHAWLCVSLTAHIVQKNRNKKVYFLFRKSSHTHDCMRQASAPAPPWNLPLFLFSLFLYFNSSKTTQRRKKQQNYTNLSLLRFSLFNMHKTVRLFVSPDIRSATRSRSDKTKKSNSVLFA